MGGPGTPPGKPGYLAIGFFDQGNNNLLADFIAFAQSKGYEVEQQSSNSVLLANYGAS